MKNVKMILQTSYQQMSNRDKKSPHNAYESPSVLVRKNIWKFLQFHTLYGFCLCASQCKWYKQDQQDIPKQIKNVVSLPNAWRTSKTLKECSLCGKVKYKSKWYSITMTQRSVLQCIFKITIVKQLSWVEHITIWCYKNHYKHAMRERENPIFAIP